MRDGYPTGLDRVFELDVTALVINLPPTIRFDRGNDVAAVHMCMNTHNGKGVNGTSTDAGFE
jgi:hypothetical protein